MKELISICIRLIGHSVLFFFQLGFTRGLFMPPWKWLWSISNWLWNSWNISPAVTVNHVQAYFIRLWQISLRKSKCTISALRSKITSVHFPKGKVFVRRWGTRAIWETSVTPLHYESAERKAGMLLYRNKNAENIRRTQGHVLHKVHNNCWPVLLFF